MDLQKKEFRTECNGKEIVLSTSRMAEQATAAILGTYGETSVLATVVMSDKDSNMPYFPLVVDFEERFYAAGKILGSRFMRREGRPSDEAILTGRLIDRTLRPLFDHRIRRQIQVVVTVLSLEEKSDLAFISLLAASTALATSSIPWGGPVAGVNIFKRKNGTTLEINPEDKEDDTEFDVLVVGTKDKINMIECEGFEADEKNIVTGLEKAQEEIKKLVEWQESIVKEIGDTKQEVSVAEPSEDTKEKIRTFLSSRLEKAIYAREKKVHEANLKQVTKELDEHLKSEGVSEDELESVDQFLDAEIDAAVHKGVLESDRRPDERALDEVRELHAEIGILARVHGSGFFIRGNTQSLAVTTLGSPGDQQLVDGIQFSGKKRFMLHYNFPSFSVGEAGRARGPGRREIGHGTLAQKAIKNILPDVEEFPYTIRVVSEILSSNGSSSMATVCATTLSLMDAGVPIKAPVAGIAMGLMTDDKGNYKILTDIQGAEDHYGDMDFKAAGTRNGITALQMDIKIGGVTTEMLKDALEHAKKARMHILDTMDATIKEPKQDISPNAPAILTTTIPVEKIGEVIGPGGKVINGIIESTGAESIDIEEDGKVFITGGNTEKARAALKEVEAIVKEYNIGEIVEGKIVKIMDFGAILEFGPNRDGMIHVSELKDGFVKEVKEVVKEGDFVKAKIIKVENGKIGLSLKNLE